MWKRNVGGLDRYVRLAVGMILVPVGLWLFGGADGQLVGLALTVLGVMALASGLSGYCPLYVPLGVSTARRSRWGGRAMARCGCRPLEGTCRSGERAESLDGPAVAYRSGDLRVSATRQH